MCGFKDIFQQLNSIGMNKHPATAAKTNQPARHCAFTNPAFARILFKTEMCSELFRRKPLFQRQFHIRRLV